MFFNSFGIDLMKMEVGLWLCTCLNYDHDLKKEKISEKNLAEILLRNLNKYVILLNVFF